ncbi:MAG: hypothetical protein CLLPBCKN_006991 [Chroococcidiopsis cubana SAG 39.79]|uniref:hypothetical protein n=1 Tax=Chroococcidiopsis cubana TaxID=171392 RepID=UPI0015E642B8|nr:hypothetical protein [Chroococcidiopsis cubana]MDZ4877556.1 hypothetical protein [Chroococcidiopsis cubana SAG 39.79]
MFKTPDCRRSPPKKIALVLTVQIILSEVGLDPSRFPTVRHFTSWLGAMSLAVALLVAKLKVLKLVL